MTVFDQFERVLRHVAKELAARDWETPAMQVLNELADEFNAAIRVREDNTALGLLSFGT